MTELRPCPSCGGEMEVETTKVDAWCVCQNFDCRLESPTRIGIDAEAEAIAASNALPRAPEMCPIAEMPERLRKEVKVLLERHNGSQTLGWWAGGWHVQDNDVDIEPDANFRAYLEIPIDSVGNPRSARANNDLSQDQDEE